MTRIKAVNLQATNKASIYGKQNDARERNYNRVRDSRQHLYSTNYIGLGLPQQTHINPKLKEKEKGVATCQLP